MNKGRIEYFDAMRGFAMFLVVVGHIMLFSFRHSNNGFFNVLNFVLEVPLFFLISGYFCDVSLKKFTAEFAAKKLYGKILMFLVAPTVFMLFYCWINNKLSAGIMFHSYKFGYWFTYALFEFIAIYYVSWLIIKLFRLSDKWSLAILLASAIGLMYVGVWFMKVQNIYSVIGLLGAVHLTNYVYFVIGVICHRYFNELQKLQNNSILTGGILAILTVGLIYEFGSGNLRYIGSYLIFTTVMSTLALFVALATFMRYSLLSSGSVIGRSLSFIGRRTLDVYFLHYFFLPRHLQMVGQWADTNNNPILTYVAAMVIAILVTGASLALGAIIRLSPLLAKLLGAR